MSKLSNLEANIELINLAKSISCLDEFTKQFNNLVLSGCLTNVFCATIDIIEKLNHDNNIYEKCMIISSKFNECLLFITFDKFIFNNVFEHILNNNINQDVLHEILVRYMFTYDSVYPTEFIDIIDLDKLYFVFINHSFRSISHKYEQIYLHFKNDKVDIDKYNDIIVDNIINRGNNDLVNLDIFNFTFEQHYKLNLYGCLYTKDTFHQTMIDNGFDYNVVKHILDTNPNYTPNIFIYNDVIKCYYGINIDKIFELLMSHGCFPQYINIVKYVIENSCFNISLESLNTHDLDDRDINRALKSLIDIVDVNPDDKNIYIPKYHENIVLPVKRYFNDNSYVNINIYLASIIDHEDENKMIKVRDFRDIVKQKYNHHVYIFSYAVYTHVDYINLTKYCTCMKTDNFIDYVLDKYSP